MGSTDHLQPHQYRVGDGAERLGAKPITVRLYASDDELVRAMQDRGQFIRDAVRAALQRGGCIPHSSGG